jgi:hypothetical protein
LLAPSGIAVDTGGSEIFVTNWEGYITVYGRTGTGNIAPVRNILVDSAGFYGLYGMALW